MKVLHLVQGYGGGVSSLVRNLIMYADKSKITQDVMAFAYHNGEVFIEEMERCGSHVFLMPRPRKEGYRAFYTYVLNIMREEKYDVVHCHTDGWRSTIYRKISRRAGVPIFCIHAHRTSNNPGMIQNNSLYIKWNQSISRKNADIRFTCGKEAAKFIYGTSEQSVTIPIGIDITHCQKAAKENHFQYKSEFGISEEEIVILHAGRFVTQKNHMFIIDIAEKLHEMNVKYKILLAGVGELLETVKEKVKEKKLDNNVLFLDRRNDVYELMGFSNLMILPSTSEGLPTVVIEAQAMGLPSLVSDSVTQECDLQIGLVKFLPLKESVTLWAETIVQLKEKKNIERETIDKALRDNAYTSQASVNKYWTVLNCKMNR